MNANQPNHCPDPNPQGALPPANRRAAVPAAAVRNTPSHARLAAESAAAGTAALLVVAALSLAVLAVFASTTEKKPDAPATHTVTRGTLKGKAQLDAVLEAVEAIPVKLELKVWSDLSVLEAVPHGSRVKRGDTLVKLETEKLRDQIEDLEQERPVATTALEIAQAELDNLTHTTPAKLESAKRSQRVADEDFTYFQTINRAQKEKNARFGVKNADQRLDNAKEELAQLQKMYDADDLTEETEEIILKRQRFAVESAEFGLESARLGADFTLNTALPREYEALRAQRRDQELALALGEQTLTRTLTKKQLDVAKLKRDQRKAEKKLADLRRDLESLAVRAPMDGLVYYGACEGGKWTTGAAVAKKLVPGGKLAANEVFMTVVNPDRLVLKAAVPENQLANFKPGLAGQASPVAAPDKKLQAKLDELGFVPLPSGGFEATLSVEKDESLRLVPGMNCKVSFEDVPKTEALLAPKEAVFTEGGQSHVFLAIAEGKHEKRSVKTGASDDKMIQVVEGLADGDKILLKKPEKSE